MVICIFQPRQHEAGGKYGLGLIVRKYRPGSTIPIRIELTANHQGYFEFRLCPNDNVKHTGTQECLDRYLLHQSKSSEARFYPGGGGNRVFEMRYKLPEGLSCTQCILQWRYIAGNNWGNCPNGTGAVGCGPQEEFRACADVAIQGDGSSEEDTYNVPGEPSVSTTPTPKSDFVEKWLIIIVVLAAFVAVCAVFALLYLYYYHASDTVKQWLHQQKPVPPPRTRKQKQQQEVI